MSRASVTEAKEMFELMIFFPTNAFMEINRSKRITKGLARYFSLFGAFIDLST